MTLHVVVIGAGIVGATTAFELVKSGHRVTIIDPGTPGGPQAASYGNGAWISPASIIPMSMPGIWRKVPGYLLDKNSPLTICWRDLPRLMPWLLRFLAAGATVSRVEATAKVLSSLLHDGPQRHIALANQLGRPDCVIQSGVLYAYPNRAAYEAEALSWRLRRDNGLRWVEIDENSLHQREPALSTHYKFGIVVETAAHCPDPGEYVNTIVKQAIKNGAALHQTKATGFEFSEGRLCSVSTSNGVISCDYAVISTGIWSKALAQQIGDHIPLESERGYHSVIHAPKVAPNMPIMPSDGRMANTLTTAGLRIAGQVELAHLDAKPNWNRVEVLLQHALATYPGLGRREELRTEYWLGHRPSTSDGLPVIGRSSSHRDIIYAFGHGHVGLAAGPITGQLVADLVSDRTSPIDIKPFSPLRFKKTDGKS